MPIGITNVQGFSDLRLVNLSTASTVVNITDDQQGALLVWNGNAGASRIVLPAAEAGMQYHFFFGDDAVSSATKFVSTSPSEIYLSNQAQVQTTAQAVALGTTLEGGMFVSFYAINDNRWALYQGARSTVSVAGFDSTTT